MKTITLKTFPVVFVILTIFTIFCVYKQLNSTPDVAIDRSISKSDISSSSVYFSPLGGCTEAIVTEIGKAKKSVFVLAYSFTSKDIANALIKAHNKGVDVRVVLDKSQVDRYSLLGYMISNRVSTTVDYKHAIQHNKVVIIDGKTVITGSFNFSAAAEKQNAENMLVLTSRNLALAYTTNWQTHASHSVVANGSSVYPVQK